MESPGIGVGTAYDSKIQIIKKNQRDIVLLKITVLAAITKRAPVAKVT